MCNSGIHIFNNSSFELLVSKMELNPVITCILTDFDQNFDSLNFIFMDNDEHTKMNVKYLGHDYDTDVITFDLSDQSTATGEVYINVHMAELNAREYKVTHKSELERLAIHGVLHLVGLNDKSEDEQHAMREKEDYYLNRFM